MKLKYIFSWCLIIAMLLSCVVGCNSGRSNSAVLSSTGPNASVEEQNNTSQNEQNNASQGDGNDSAQDKQNNVSQSDGNDSTQDEQNDASYGEVNDIYQGCTHPLYHTSDITAYQSFIQTDKRLPDNFITYAQISSFGDFRYFVCEGPDFSAYSYVLIAENGLEFTLSINHTEPNRGNQLPEIRADIIGETMETLTKEERGIIVKSGIRYWYVIGKLINMEWEIDGVYFQIGVDSTWDDYPAFNSDSILARMLSPSESVSAEAIKEVNAFIAENRKNAD